MKNIFLHWRNDLCLRCDIHVKLYIMCHWTLVKTNTIFCCICLPSNLYEWWLCFYSFLMMMHIRRQSYATCSRYSHYFEPFVKTSIYWYDSMYTCLLVERKSKFIYYLNLIVENVNCYSLNDIYVELIILILTLYLSSHTKFKMSSGDNEIDIIWDFLRMKQNFKKL